MYPFILYETVTHENNLLCLEVLNILLYHGFNFSFKCVFLNWIGKVRFHIRDKTQRDKQGKKY